MKYVEKRHWAISLDPIHIGSGGYRLGRVDNTIVRDPTTDVPKIPGTSLAGAYRAYAELAKKEKGNVEKEVKDKKEVREKVKEEIKKIFGDENQQGIVRFFDAHIVLFPVSSIQGTVWITTKDLLEHWFDGIKNEDGEELKIPKDANEDKAMGIKGINKSKPFNLGWLMLDVKVIDGVKNIQLPSGINGHVKKIVMVSEKLFSHIINDNLEVRTSVKIDPNTGAAASGALFTYEAIPRGTVLGFDVVIDKRNDINEDIEGLLTSTNPYLKMLGIGGLGTRGFGRMDVMSETNGRTSGGSA